MDAPTSHCSRTRVCTTRQRHDNKYYSSWRLLALVCAVPSAVGALLVYMLVPESPRFLALQQQPQALKVVNQLAHQMEYHGPSLT
jgi:hypothetical protein